MNRRHFLQASSLAATTSFAPMLRAQPAGPITTLVGFAAGSAVDIAARFVTQAMAPRLDRPIIVDNRAGAGGQMAFTTMQRAPADGSVIAFVPSNLLALFPIIYDTLPYDTVDATPIATACTFELALVVANDHPARNLQEFIDWCRKHPERASFGNPGLGTPHHFLGWTFGQSAGMPFEPVAYRSTPQMAQETAAGQIASSLAALPVFAEFIRSGRLRALALTGTERNPLFPDVPTFKESGYDEMVSVEWFGFFARRDTPNEIIGRYAQAVTSAVAEPKVQAQLESMGFRAVAHGADWLNASIKDDLQRWGEVVKKTGFKAQS